MASCLRVEPIKDPAIKANILLLLELEFNLHCFRVFKFEQAMLILKIRGLPNTYSFGGAGLLLFFAITPSLRLSFAVTGKSW